MNTRSFLSAILILLLCDHFAFSRFQDSVERIVMVDSVGMALYSTFDNAQLPDTLTLYAPDINYHEFFKYAYTFAFGSVNPDISFRKTYRNTIAGANIKKGGRRFVYYNKAKFDSLLLLTSNENTITSVLLHELGHLVNNHPLRSKKNGARRLFELEADYYAGRMMRQLNSSMAESYIALELFGNRDTVDYPPVPVRIQRNQLGWLKKGMEISKGSSPEFDSLIQMTSTFEIENHVRQIRYLLNDSIKIDPGDSILLKQKMDRSLAAKRRLEMLYVQYDSVKRNYLKMIDSLKVDEMKMLAMIERSPIDTLVTVDQIIQNFPAYLSVATQLAYLSPKGIFYGTPNERKEYMFYGVKLSGINARIYANGEVIGRIEPAGSEMFLEKLNIENKVFYVDNEKQILTRLADGTMQVIGTKIN